MGTGHPHVEITAATLAGGSKNQDRYAYGDGWAFVLDGASSFGNTQPDHDGGWYAERLRTFLAADLSSKTGESTVATVARAIEAASAGHPDPKTCPSSTIALARWSAETVETYVLGDSTVALIADDREFVISDLRLADVAAQERAEYRSRLAGGYGFDARHQELLQDLQATQAAARNRANGYWIAGAEPEAAHHGLTDCRPRSQLHAVVLATDGAAAGIRYGHFPTWAAFVTGDPQDTLHRVHAVESEDPLAMRWPRSKLHDDKTTVCVLLPKPRAGPLSEGEQSSRVVSTLDP